MRRDLEWSGRRDSNPRPRPWQGRALPAELLSRLAMANLSINLILQKLNVDNSKANPISQTPAIEPHSLALVIWILH